jgi:hypothetical protein
MLTEYWGTSLHHVEEDSFQESVEATKEKALWSNMLGGSIEHPEFILFYCL